jgi:hypothetical protein
LSAGSSELRTSVACPVSSRLIFVWFSNNLYCWSNHKGRIKPRPKWPIIPESLAESLSESLYFSKIQHRKSKLVDVFLHLSWSHTDSLIDKVKFFLLCRFSPQYWITIFYFGFTYWRCFSLMLHLSHSKLTHEEKSRDHYIGTFIKGNMFSTETLILPVVIFKFKGFYNLAMCFK